MFDEDEKLIRLEIKNEKLGIENEKLNLIIENMQKEIDRLNERLYYSETRF